MGLTVATSRQWPNGSRCAAVAGERGKKKGLDRRIMGGRKKRRRPTRPLGRPPYSPSLFLFVLGKPRFGLPWIFLLLLGMPTAAPSRARFCLCGNRPGSPFVSIRQVETLRVRRARPGAVSREWNGDQAIWLIPAPCSSHVQWTRCSAYIVTTPRGHMTCVTPFLWPATRAEAGCQITGRRGHPSRPVCLAGPSVQLQTRHGGMTLSAANLQAMHCGRARASPWSSLTFGGPGP